MSSALGIAEKLKGHEIQAAA